jgi:hypothetical protein
MKSWQDQIAIGPSERSLEKSRPNGRRLALGHSGRHGLSGNGLGVRGGEEHESVAAALSGEQPRWSVA